MIITSLKFKNFRCFKDAELSFGTDNGTGITLILGSGGSGKTTILGSILWVLYNVNVFYGSESDLINNDEKEKLRPTEKVEASVEINLLKNETRYCVVRRIEGYKQIDGSLKTSPSSRFTIQYIGDNKVYFTDDKIIFPESVDISYISFGDLGNINRKKIEKIINGYVLSFPNIDDAIYYCKIVRKRFYQMLIPNDNSKKGRKLKHIIAYTDALISKFSGIKENKKNICNEMIYKEFKRIVNQFGLSHKHISLEDYLEGKEPNLGFANSMSTSTKAICYIAFICACRNIRRLEGEDNELPILLDDLFLSFDKEKGWAITKTISSLEKQIIAVAFTDEDWKGRSITRTYRLLPDKIGYCTSIICQE